MGAGLSMGSVCLADGHPLVPTAAPADARLPFIGAVLLRGSDGSESMMGPVCTGTSRGVVSEEKKLSHRIILSMYLGMGCESPRLNQVGSQGPKTRQGRRGVVNRMVPTREKYYRPKAPLLPPVSFFFYEQ